MALRAPAVMALFLVLSLMAVVHCVVPLEEATKDSSSAAVTGADWEGEGLIRLPSREDSAVPVEVGTEGGEVVPVAVEEEPVEPVAEPDPDRSNPDSDDGVEELTAAEKLSIEGQEDDEKTEEQIHDDEDDEKEKTKEKNRDGGDGKEEEKKKGKKQRGGEGNGKKEKEKKMMKKHHQRNDDKEEEEEKTKKNKIHHRHHVEKPRTKKRPCHDKTNRNNNGDDSDDEDDEHEKKAKRWRKKAISRSLFGHGRRSQREEAAKEEVNN